MAQRHAQAVPPRRGRHRPGRAERLALAAGATKATDQPNPDRWRVLLDPAGHPFCVTTLIPA
ncbi:VOC family protein [Nonomuraea sp. NPDC049141]|uniref:VOC family protein n=1 Tax=Nonomuraea sp. NPDC049141 TaxID=3155500 RepID=UPI0033D80F45